MQTTITGHHMELTDSLRDYVQQKIIRLERHFDNITQLQVVLSVEKERHTAAATLAVAGAELHATEENDDMYAAIDIMADKLDRQLVKYKEKNQARSQGLGSFSL